jgi:hypothetical protein
MAPEMNRLRESKGVIYDGKKVDIYAIGITLLSLAFNIRLISKAT